MDVSVQDEGIGIEEKNKARLFKLFGCIQDEESQVNTKGIGLGLVISRMIVNHFGGDVSFESQHHVGSTFRFNFITEKICDGERKTSSNTQVHIPNFELESFQPPTRKSSLISYVNPKATSLIASSIFQVSNCSYDEVMKRRIFVQANQIRSLLATGRKRILIVDDESTCLMGVRAMLKSLAIDVDLLVDVAITGREALQSVEASISLGLDYQIIFTDISMPEMDGLEASKNIR